jgi:heme/copper-type cytochrome/quinol oxidase subunit 3
MNQRVLDVSDLPHGTADSRALLWWGNLGMMAIEGTMFAMVLATYLYLRVSNLDWPPPTVPKPSLVLPAINLVLLLLLFIPALVIDRASLRDDAATVKIALMVCVAGGVGFLIIRAIDMAALGFKWSDHAYGSVVWTIFFLHTLHRCAATGETTLLLIYSEMRPVMKKTLLDFRCLAVYWYFVILWWLPFFFVIYVEPWMRRKGS